MARTKNIFASIWLGIAQLFLAMALIWNHIIGNLYNIHIIVVVFFLAIISLIVGILKDK